MLASVHSGWGLWLRESEEEVMEFRGSASKAVMIVMLTSALIPYSSLDFKLPAGRVDY